MLRSFIISSHAWQELIANTRTRVPKTRREPNMVFSLLFFSVFFSFKRGTSICMDMYYTMHDGVILPTLSSAVINIYSAVTRKMLELVARNI
jgi:hypothetical protein